MLLNSLMSKIIKHILGDVELLYICFLRMGYHFPSAYNPAEFFIKALAVVPGCEEMCKQTIKSICEHFAVSDYAKQIDVVVQYEFHLGENEGVSVLLW